MLTRRRPSDPSFHGNRTRGAAVRIPPERDGIAQGAAILGFLLVAVPSAPALAQTLPPEDAATVKHHAVSAEVGVFTLSKDQGSGVGIGLGYAFRPVKGLELGVGLRYLVVPATTTDAFILRADGTPSAPPEHYVEPAIQFGFASVSVRGFVPLDSGDRFELGLTGRVGLLARNSKPGVCCSEVSVAPDLRMKLARTTALQLSPEIGIGSTGDHNGPDTEDYVDEIFLQTAVWLSVVQAF